MNVCPEGSITRKIQLLWADKGLMQTFDCIKESRREYILLLNDRGYAEAQAMIPEGASVPQVVQYQEYDSNSVLRTSKKFGLDGQMQRLERFSATGVLILRYRQDQSLVEEFSATVPGEKVKTCSLISANNLLEQYKVLGMELEVSEKTESGLRLIEVKETIKDNDSKTLLKSDENNPYLPGQVQLAPGIVGIEQCFVTIDEKKLIGKFQFGNKKIIIPQENAYPLSDTLQHLKSMRSEETKSFLERFESR